MTCSMYSMLATIQELLLMNRSTAIGQEKEECCGRQTCGQRMSRVMRRGLKQMGLAILSRRQWGPPPNSTGTLPSTPGKKHLRRKVNLPYLIGRACFPNL